MVDLDTRRRLARIGQVVGYTTFVVGLLGDILGWWDALGIIVSLAGLVVGLFSTMDESGIALLEGQSTTHTVLMRLASGQARMEGNQEAMLSNQEAMLENQEAVLENHEEMIDVLQDIAGTLDERLPNG